MVLIFDLDDTLYDELSYVHSGLWAVANFGEVTFGFDSKQSLHFMCSELQVNGRGKIFDNWLKRHGAFTKKRLEECIRAYRHHEPKIQLFPEAVETIEFYRRKTAVYVVTDGHKIVQDKKINALGLRPLLKRAFITHRFGVRNAKPSLHCFKLIQKAERCEWADMVYIGDNPSKDFVNLNSVGAFTVRVATGAHASALVSPSYDAQAKIPDLSHLAGELSKWQSNISRW
jgi:putative hydrolase of the HAD superfamily